MPLQEPNVSFLASTATVNHNPYYFFMLVCLSFVIYRGLSSVSLYMYLIVFHLKFKADYFLLCVIAEGVVPSKKSPLESFLTAKLPDNVQIQDASLPVLALLRVFQALNRYWGSLYTTLEYKPLIPHQVRTLFKSYNCYYNCKSSIIIEWFKAELV